MKQQNLFHTPKESTCDTEWVNMPEYNNVKQEEPYITSTFKFRNEHDYNVFKDLVQEHLYKGEKVFDGMQKLDKKSAWFPHKQKASAYIYKSKKTLNPRFPVYIVSKGRWKRNPTSRALQEMKVPFYMVVEEDQFDDYKTLVDEDNLLILPKKYIDEYDVFWNDDDPRKGPGCARNFCWEHSMKNGYDWHWVMDDNIEAFERYNNNMKVKCLTGSPFYAMEDFVLRYENIAQAGPNYSIFCPATDGRPQYKLNTRIYSCLLINNKIPFRWRGRYNEDTDLSLRAMKDGWCTVQFNAFLQSKRATQTLKGGNTEEFYAKDGTYNKSKMLVEMHPDVAFLSDKWNRVHHHVNYEPFKKNILKKKNNVNEVKPNNFNMYLESLES
tara:strand:- start:332 stop:1477 length:1146 start_codon:yes stop_codon:yes gene_type:complete